MPNTKKITLDHSETGKTVYCIISRNADGYLVNDSGGAFASAPADPYISLAEHGTIKGRYSLSESRAAWNDGLYQVAIYKQAGGSPSPTADTIIGSGGICIVNDLEVDQSVVYDKLVELREGNIKREFTVATVQVGARNVDVGRIDSMTVKVKADTASDWTSPVSTKTLYFRYATMGNVNPSSVGD